MDYKATPHLAIGLSAGYTGTSADLADGGRLFVNGGKFGLYGTYYEGDLYLDGAVSGGYNSYDTRRSALQGQARGSTNGGEFNALFGAGYDWKRGDLTFGPTAGFQYTYVGMRGFAESGSLAPLDVAGDHNDSTRTTLGFKARYDWKIGSVLVKPEVRVAWQHEYGDNQYGITSRFADGGGDSFQVEGGKIGRDSLFGGRRRRGAVQRPVLHVCLLRRRPWPRELPKPQRERRIQGGVLSLNRKIGVAAKRHKNRKVN